VRKSEIVPAAKVFLDWAIGDDIMQLYAGSYPITSVATEIPIPDGYPADPLAQLVENDFVRMAGEREQILAQWTERYDGKSEPR
jgi:iron(III) transport system substrate-binding protein